MADAIPIKLVLHTAHRERDVLTAVGAQGRIEAETAQAHVVRLAAIVLVRTPEDRASALPARFSFVVRIASREYREPERIRAVAAIVPAFLGL